MEGVARECEDREDKNREEEDMDGKIRERMHEEEEQELSHISKDLECTRRKCQLLFGKF